MSSRRSTSYDDAGPSKRQKVYRACIACVNSKTRCEDVTPLAGCLRCRSKNKACSLVQIDSRPTLIQNTSSDDNSTARLSELEAEHQMLRQRLDRLEHDMFSRSVMSVPPPNSASHVNTPSFPAQSRPVGIHAIYTTLHWQSIPMTERVFNISSDLGYPDPVTRGIVTAEEMELAFHLFKHRFSSLIPLIPYLSSSTPTPTHPLVMLAVLAHAAPSPQLWSLVEEGILVVTSGAVGPDVPLALLILSLAPGPTDTTRAPMAAVRIIALAYSVGQMMGWDSASEVWCRSRWITFAEWSIHLDQILLWETIKNRYNILSMMQGMTPTLAHSHADRMPATVPDQYTRSLAYIKMEAGLVDTFAPILSRLCIAEAESYTREPDMRSLLDAWSPAAAGFERWKVDSKSFSKLSLYDGYALRFSLAFRLSCVVQRIPTPTDLESRIGGQSFTGLNLLRYSVALLEIFNALPDGDLKIFPVYLHFQTIIGLSVQQRSIAYVRRTGGDWANDMVPIVDAAIGRIRNCIGGLPLKMFEMADEQYHNDQFIPEMDFEALFAALPKDWLETFEGEWGSASLSGNVAPMW